MPPAVLRQVLDGQAETSRAGRTDHQPVAAPGKVLVGQRVAEHLVIGSEVVDVDPRLRNAGRAAGLEREDGLVGKGLRHPPADGPAPQPLVLEEAESVEVRVGPDLLPRVPVELLREVQPERRAGLGIEVPPDDVADVGVEIGRGNGAHA